MIIIYRSTIEQWKREIETWSDMNCFIYHGSQRAREIIYDTEWFFFPEPNSQKNKKNDKKKKKKEKKAKEPKLYKFQVSIDWLISPSLDVISYSPPLLFSYLYLIISSFSSFSTCMYVDCVNYLWSMFERNSQINFRPLALFGSGRRPSYQRFEIQTVSNSEEISSPPSININRLDR